MPARWQSWVLAARVPTLPAAVVPVLVGTAVAAHSGGVRFLPALAALAVALLLQIGTNFANDAFDFLRGADTTHRRGPTRAVQSGFLSSRQMLAGAYICFGLAALVGLYFVVLHGWGVLVVGLLAIASGLGYTGGPWPIGYHALGEIFVFVFFGVVAVTGTAYVQTGHLSAFALAASVPVGLLVTAILIVNNLRDIDTDAAAGKRTLAVFLGGAHTRSLYVFCLVAAALAPVVLRAAGLTGMWFWLPWIAAPMMVALIRTALGERDAAGLNRLLRQTARLHLVFGVLLAASLQ
jgi:1,4-dihydroxy-2-naphthoate octaprenyltransferase